MKWDNTANYTWIRFNDDINLYELVGCACFRDKEEEPRMYIEEEINVIHTGSKESCIELEKKLSPKKYF